MATVLSSERRTARPNTAPRRAPGEGRAASLFLAPTLGGFTLFTLLPILGSLFVALTVWPLAGNPTFVGLQNFVKLFQDQAFLGSVGVMTHSKKDPLQTTRNRRPWFRRSLYSRSRRCFRSIGGKDDTARRLPLPSWDRCW